MESEQEIRMSQLHEQLLQSQIGHQTASSHGAEDRHSKKQVCCRPAHFLCRYEEFVEYTVDGDSVKTLTKGYKKKKGCIFAW